MGSRAEGQEMRPLAFLNLSLTSVGGTEAPHLPLGSPVLYTGEAPGVLASLGCWHGTA